MPSTHRRPLASATVLAGILTLGCASPPALNDPVLVSREAKLDGDVPAAAFLCRVEAGDDGFARVDTLHCESPEGAVFVPSIDVSSSGGHEGSMRLSDGPGSVRFYGDRYPATVHAYGYLTDTFAGLDGVRLDSELTLESEAGWESAQGPALPFEVWTVELTARVSVAQLGFETYVIEGGDGMRLSRDSEEGAVEVRPSTTLVRSGETKRLSFAAPTDGSPIRGTLTVDSTPVAFELDRGGALVITREGLVPAQGFEAPAAGGDLVRCDPSEGGSSCALVVRPGVVVSEASITADGASHALPLDGAAVEVPSAASLSARVVIAEGIDGLDLTRFGAIEGELAPVEGVPTLQLPFALMHLTVAVVDGDRAFFDAQEQHRVAFSEAIGGLFESEDHLSVSFSETRPDVWIATSEGVTEIMGRMTVIGAVGTVNEVEGVVLSAGQYELGRAGLSVPAVIETGTELARCWLSPEAQLNCDRLESAQIEESRLNLLLESRDRDVWLDLGAGESSVITLAPLLPVTLTIEVRIAGGATASAMARITQASDLPEGSPLLVAAP